MIASLYKAKFSYFNMGFWTLVGVVIKESDIVVHVADARTPGLSRNQKVSEVVKKAGKDFLLVFNKIDLISKEGYFDLKKEFPDAMFVSGARNKGIKKLKERLLIMAKRRGIEVPKVGIVGYPNVGKSSIINALAKRARASVSAKAGTTRGIQWVRAGGLLVIDSPGVIPYRDREETLAYIGAKNAEKIEFPERVAIEIIKNFRQVNPEVISKFYKIILVNDDYENLLNIGRARGYLLKGNKVDENRTVLQIIRDWQRGKIGQIRPEKD
jgi:ribosome biogenesis GTPase A